MTGANEIAAKLANLAARGIACAPGAGGKLMVHPPSLLLAADRDWLRQNARAAVAYLRADEPWDLKAALALAHDADTAVAESGVSGAHPDVQAAVSVVMASYRAMDLRRVRAACAALRATVQRLAGRVATGRNATFGSGAASGAPAVSSS
jgi:hypothetical protein